MADLEGLSEQAAQTTIGRAARQRAEVVVTARFRNRWAVFTSQLLEQDDGVLRFSLPGGVQAASPEEVIRDQTVGLSFRAGNHRYFFSARVASFGRHTNRDGLKVPMFEVPTPREMTRLSRRIYERIDVPTECRARATIWPGGRETSIEEGSPERPTWSGRLANLSVGGFQMATESGPLSFFQAGDLVGARLLLQAGDEPVNVDAQFRYGMPDGSMSLLGFAFIALDERDDAREFLQKVLDAIQRYRSG